MIDWFASKIGVLIFLVAALSILMFFGGAQIELMDQGRLVSAANDLARLSEGLCEGCSVAYSFDREHAVRLEGSNVTVSGISRLALARFEGSDIVSRDIVLEKRGGYVRAYEA